MTDLDIDAIKGRCEADLALVAEGWWHPNVRDGRVHDHRRPTGCARWCTRIGHPPGSRAKENHDTVT